LVQRAELSGNYADAVARWQARTVKPLFEAVFDQPEQTLARAKAEQPPRGQFYIPLGCEGGRQRFGVEPSGGVFCVNDRIDLPVGKDTKRRTWGGDRLHYTFDLPSGKPEKRWIEENSLPIIHAEWESKGVRYTQTAFATRLGPGGLGYPDMQADDTTVLMVQIVADNTMDDAAQASVKLGLEVDGHKVELLNKDDLVYAKLGSGEVLRCVMHPPEGANVSIIDGGVSCAGELPAKEHVVLEVAIPFITLDRPDEIEQLTKMDYDHEFERVSSFWRSRADASAQIHVPSTDLAGFYRAHVSHLMINCGREVGTDRLMARVGGFAYGVYGNESCMMITDLDHRGFHKEAERCLETFLAYQGTSRLPGDFSTSEGVFNGANGWESGGYNQHHGWILWAMAEHYWFSGDAAWLKHNADKLLKACQWITHERNRTKEFDPASLRGIERGLIPPGSLEDIGDWRCWMSNNGFSWWGMDSVAKALADIKHPQAAALQAEADAFKKDFLAAFTEAMVRAPVVRLRDGRYIPQIPSEVHRRGRTYGWITTTLEGSIYLIRTGAIEPTDPMALCILEDYEDNLYLSEQFGYPLKHMTNWFSRGGFSQQPNLLCSPLPYLARDEIKHFLRSYFNGFISCYYPDTQMLCEHPLPDLGDFRGDHYKSSDESNSAYWLRLMFIDERKNDLYLGMALPRDWLADGLSPEIQRAATRFGPMSLRFESHAAQRNITAFIDPPTRRVPGQVFLRFRHPEQKRLARVEMDGHPLTSFDAAKELIQLPALRGSTKVVAWFAE